MVPFGLKGTWTVERIREGTFTIEEVVATLKDDRGQTRDLTMVQHWPVRRAIPDALVKAGQSERLYPSEPLITTLRLIDTFFPIARGGMGCIPGPPSEPAKPFCSR
jgi:V/A-type H+-transporting ATPase subunit A